MEERRVVLPALSRPRRRMEYSARLSIGNSWGEEIGSAGYTFFAGCVGVDGFGEVVHGGGPL
jgi:hypothetical protein